MQQLLPQPGDRTPGEAYAVARPRRAGRPWIALMMVASADGAAAVDGRTGALGGPADRAVFHALRAAADVVLVGAGTARDEDYGPPHCSPDDQAARRERGQAPHPRLVVVSRRLDLDPGRRLFRDAHPGGRPVIVHPPGAPARRRADLAPVADLVEVAAGPTGIDVSTLPSLLAGLGADLVAAEGGPTLNGALLRADLVDELCLTLDPTLVGGSAPRIVTGAEPDGPRRFRTAHLLHADDVLFWRLVRDRSGNDRPATG